MLGARGIVSEYRWAWDVQTIVDALLSVGPVVVGLDWYSSMFSPRKVPDAMGTYRSTLVIADDAVVSGGHAFVLNGVNTDARMVRMKNSWGLGWAVGGRSSMSFDTLDRLLNDGGDACIAVQRRG